jgi:hypothetical protein
MVAPLPDPPHHDDVVAAAAAADDAELVAWAGDPDDYVLVPVEFDEADHHDFFALTPLAVSHPIGVLLARSRHGGDLVPTSGNPDGVWRVLRADPTLAQPDTIVQLLGRPWDTTEYLGPGSEPPIVAEAGGWRCDLRVREGFDGPPERWRVTLAERSSWQVES